MRRVIGGLLLSCLLATVFYLGMTKKAAMAYNQENLIRFHVIAASDLDQDQNLKNEIKEILLEQLKPVLQGIEDTDEATALINGELENLRLQAEGYLREKGMEEEVQVKYGSHPFPAKGYGTLVLPAGEYKALRIIIGEGQGANWWCVLFPPLCFVDIANGVPDEESVDAVLDQMNQEPLQPELKFKTWEVIKGSKFNPL